MAEEKGKQKKKRRRKRRWRGKRRKTNASYISVSRNSGDRAFPGGWVDEGSKWRLFAESSLAVIVTLLGLFEEKDYSSSVIRTERVYSHRH